MNDGFSGEQVDVDGVDEVGKKPVGLEEMGKGGTELGEVHVETGETSVGEDLQKALERCDEITDKVTDKIIDLQMWSPWPRSGKMSSWSRPSIEQPRESSRFSSGDTLPALDRIVGRGI